MPAHSRVCLVLLVPCTAAAVARARRLAPGPHSPMGSCTAVQRDRLVALAVCRRTCAMLSHLYLSVGNGPSLGSLNGRLSPVGAAGGQPQHMSRCSAARTACEHNQQTTMPPRQHFTTGYEASGWHGRSKRPVAQRYRGRGQGQQRMQGLCCPPYWHLSKPRKSGLGVSCLP